MSAERRTQERHELWFPVRISAEGLSTNAVCCNISEGGMQLAVPESIAEGTEVKLRFHVPRSPHPQSRVARVVRAMSNEGVDSLQWPQKIGVAFD